MIEPLLALLEKGQDSALLRYTLGTAYLQTAQPSLGLEHLHKALELDPNYSAAWKAYGRCLAELDDFQGAKAAYAEGINVAERRGDKQAAKEMRVFLRRVEKKLS